ncbi:uncharacterized protein LOC126898853 [Daktulosphaira vitifoliae]|uniref:uncharacterized protein LOC126898853 n=1 Tax=Daktulosphaira vitifoliae TaxID=58002 RepID=UPI0021AAAFEF|nr:uncharacterized protein LOC126898853 [Daktulosphaira vitifoliae]
MCPECKGDLISESLVCSICKRIKKVNGDSCVLLKCCNIYACKDCISFKMKARCLCGKDLVEANVVCMNCKYIRQGDNGNLLRMKCCKKKLCEFCLINDRKTSSCSCGEDLMKGIPFENVRKCSECKTNAGMYCISYGSPQILCEDCFTAIKVNYHGRYRYCKKREPKNASNC